MNDVFMDIMGYSVSGSFLPETLQNIRIRKDPTSTFVSLTNERNQTFLDSLVSILEKTVSVVSILKQGSYSFTARCEYYKSTMQAMTDGCEVIHNAVLHNNCMFTYGVADLLIRSDKLASLFPHEPCVDVGVGVGAHPQLKKYVLLSVKDVKLPLTSDGKHLKNNQSTRVLKGVSFLLNQALGVMQGYTPLRSYVIGSRWSYIHETNEYHGNSCFDKIGVVDFLHNDTEISDYSREGVTWIRSLQENKISQTMKHKTYPNMCQKNDYPYHSLKKVFADTHCEITAVWCCNEVHRVHAMDQGVYSWKDPNCTIDILGISGEYYRDRVQAILDINRQTSDIIRRIGSREVETQDIIGSLHTSETRTYYIDFETTTVHSRNVMEHDIVTIDSTLIAMIGCGWVDGDGVWRFRSFVVDTLSLEGERVMVQQFYDMLVSHTDNTTCMSTCIHWGHAEKTNLRDVIKRHSDHDWYMLNLFDLCDYFKKNIIVVRGALTFGLKDVTRALHSNGVIDDVWDQNSDCMSGMDAMVQLLTIHQDVMRRGVLFSEHEMIRDIKTYNEVDCKVLYDILEFYLCANIH
jgi:hypothetical protein